MICYGIYPFFLFARSRVNFTLQNSMGIQMMDQLPDILQTSVRSLSDASNQVPTTYGYFPESSKSILVVAPHNVEQAEVEFAGLNFQVETGAQLHRCSHGKRTLD